MAAQQVSSVKQYFDTLHERFIASAAKGVKATYQFELAGDGGGTYHVKVDDGTMTVAEGPDRVAEHDDQDGRRRLRPDGQRQAVAGRWRS